MRRKYFMHIHMQIVPTVVDSLLNNFTENCSNKKIIQTRDGYGDYLKD